MFRPEMIAIMIPILALLIPIIAILTGHQRAMAEIIHNSANPQRDQEFLRMQAELQDLKQLVHQQAIAMDNLVQLQTRAQSPGIQERLEAR